MVTSPPQLSKLPVLPLAGAVLFPGNTLTLPAIEELPAATRRTLGRAGARIVAVPQEADSLDAKLATVGTEAVVDELLRLPHGGTGVVLRGTERRRVLGMTWSRGSATALVEPLDDRGSRAQTLAAMTKALALAARRLTALKAEAAGYPASLATAGDLPGGAAALCFYILGQLSLPIAEQLPFLASTNLPRRCRAVMAAFAREEELLQLAARIRDEAALHAREGQRRLLLKEQLRRLKQELGDEEPAELGELATLARTTGALPLPEIVKSAVDRELARMEQMAPGSPDYLVSFNYLTWISELPWDVAVPPPPSVAAARRVLDAEHEGLGAVKERILEYVAVLHQTGRSHGEILLLVGPPGVGKTSLARRIAAALDRPFASLSLGGVKDEAEIRGHRRTYVGALPGKLLHAMRQAKSRAPVVLLDEVDKVGLDQGRGTLSSALLEVLDYGQNHAFTDHYLGLPYDLSDVVFIATANSVASIPGALLDRMEIVELPSYTEDEKLKIASRHLLPQLRSELGLKARQLHPSASLILSVIRRYTREAGVRQLRRELAAIGRKVVKTVAEGRRPPALAAASLPRYLGPARFIDEPNDAKLAAGVALGLAYTEIGGDILYIESTRTPVGAGANGRSSASPGRLSLTGSIGPVMKESAQAALAYLRSLAFAQPGLLPFDADLILDSHIHLHLPAGGTPKDGPSAGLAIVCAIASLLSGRPLPARLALTGEISLRGQVLPVGGIKEKFLAAHRYGKTRVIFPAANSHDLASLPASVRRQLDLVPVQSMTEALAAAGLTGSAGARVRAVQGRVQRPKLMRLVP